MNVKIFKVSNATILNQCYLIYRDNAGVLIDPAWNFHLINNFLDYHQISLKGVLLTHSHFDHCNLADEFATKKNVPVFMSGIEIDKYNFYCQNLHRVNHLQQIILDGFGIVPLLTPGHTDGSTCYLINDHLFTGDTIFIEGVGICSRGDIDKLYNSVQFLKRHISPDILVWPGHSFGQTPGKDMRFVLKNNIYFQLENKKFFTDFRMRKNRPSPFSFK